MANKRHVQQIKTFYYSSGDSMDESVNEYVKNFKNKITHWLSR